MNLRDRLVSVFRTAGRSSSRLWARLSGGTTRRAAGRTSTRRGLAVLLVSLAAATAPGAVAASNPTAPVAAPPTADACGPAAPGYYTCLSRVRTDIAPRSRSQVTPVQLPGGLGPGGPTVPGLVPGLQDAYSLTSEAANDGAGETVAIVDAYDQHYAFTDVNTYRQTYGIPSLVAYNTGSPWFQQVSQTGTGNLPTANTSWNLEISLDIDMVSAICPNCNILLVEANSASFSDLGAAVNYAATVAGVVAISNSYGTGDFAGESFYDSYYNHSGIAVTAATGDSGYGLLYPASSKYVVAVGGTALSAGGTGRGGWTETAWSEAGSGCSANEIKPNWQHDYGCTGRTGADVSAVASCSTPVAVYDTYDNGWIEVCGTSAASPIIASLFALAGKPATNTYPASYLYNAPADLYDVTPPGSNGTCSPAYLCTAEVGYDGPTGLGTPYNSNGDLSAFNNLTAGTAPGAPMNVTATAGNAQATVSFSPPAASGGRPITLYTATSTPGNETATGTTASPITVSGLSNNVAYTFTVTATNAQGPGEASAPSNSVTPTASTATVPGAPTGVTATAGNGQATVSFTPPASNGSPITSYTVTSSPGSKTATGTVTTITVTGLTIGTAYTFTVTATNSVGTGPPSLPSNSVTPTAPLTITTTSLAAGRLSRFYSVTLKATGGLSPYTWALNSGTLPPGLTLGTSGTISGRPTSSGTFSFTVSVTDRANNLATSQTLSITISRR